MQHVDVLIVGAGISGIGAACHLRMKQPDQTFTIVEGRDAIGGTWDLFRYPGIRSDSDMYTFGYAFKPWVEDNDIATGEAILRYLNETVDEYGLRNHIRFNHRVEKVAWSSQDRRWVATVRRDDDTTVTIACRFLITGTGYYNYEHGHLPAFEGYDDFQGVIAHPQHWPEDLDYAGKKVLVIGSGATAVTLVPSMAETAGHVTMLQRSPTYIFSRPAADAVAKKLREVLPTKVAHKVARAKNIGLSWFFYTFAQKQPDRVRARLRALAVEALGDTVDVDVHFKPRYDPWDQRLCLVPDGDLFDVLVDGRASIVTDTIDRFTERGVKLTSGEVLEADVIVPATGLELQFLGGMEMEVDGTHLEPSDLVSYRGMMFGNVPNFVAMIGYTNASWTLKVDLTADYLCQLLAHMKEHGYATVVPHLDDPAMETQPIMARLSSGYVKRAADRMPKQGTRGPWQNRDHYLRDRFAHRFGRLDDGVLRFTKDPAASRPARFEVRGKTAVVTGAGSGIGAALAEELAAEGCHLALVDIHGDRLEEVAARVRKHEVAVSTHVVDVGDADAVDAFATKLGETHPRIELLINNAGVALGGTFEEASRDDFEWLMNVNFYGVVNLTRALLPKLRAQPDAHVANVSSVFGMIAPPNQTAYCASKFAVRGFSESLRHELAGSTVGVSVIHPGGIKTRIARDARVPAALAADARDDDVAREAAEFEKNFITTPQKAAQIILAGIAERKPRIMVGPDAKLIEWLERLFPTGNVAIIERLAQWQAKRQAGRPGDGVPPIGASQHTTPPRVPKATATQAPEGKTGAAPPSAEASPTTA